MWELSSQEPVCTELPNHLFAVSAICDPTSWGDLGGREQYYKTFSLHFLKTSRFLFIFWLEETVNAFHSYFQITWNTTSLHYCVSLAHNQDIMKNYICVWIIAMFMCSTCKIFELYLYILLCVYNEQNLQWLCYSLFPITRSEYTWMQTSLKPVRFSTW